MKKVSSSECTGNFFISNGDIKPVSLFEKTTLVTGVSLYEVIKIKEKIPLFREDHIKRLFYSAEVAGIRNMPEAKLVESYLNQLIGRHPLIDQGNIRIHVHFRDISDEKPRVMCYFIPHYYPSVKEYESGVPLVLLEAERQIVHSKIINLDFRSYINQKISEEGGYEALLKDSSGFITEGSKSNFFMIRNEKVITAPVEDVLPGITRDKIIDICRISHIEIEERKIHYSELKECDSCFITGTSPGILAVSNIGPVRFSVAHPLLSQLSGKFNILVKEYINFNKPLIAGKNKNTNMSDLIIFMSLHGCAEKAALLFRDMSLNDVVLVNLRNQTPPPLENFNTVIIGGSIHMGTIQGKIRKFCDENEKELLTKRLGLYVCHMQEGKTAIRQFNDAFSENMRNHAIAKGLFGGEFNIDRMDKFEKTLMKKTSGLDKTIARIDTKAIDGFGRVIFRLDQG